MEGHFERTLARVLDVLPIFEFLETDRDIGERPAERAQFEHFEFDFLLLAVADMTPLLPSMS